MSRLIGGVVLGYIAMFLVVFVSFTLAYLAMGPDRAFRAGVYDVSPLWIATSFVVGFGAALLGGWTARRVSRGASGPRVLVGVVLALGVAMALSVLFGEPAAAGARTEAIGPMEAMQVARTPFWIMLLNPVVGALGALVGGRALGAAGASEARAAAAPTA